LFQDALRSSASAARRAAGSSPPDAPALSGLWLRLCRAAKHPG